MTTLSDTTTNVVTISASGSDLQVTVDGVTSSRPIASVSAVTIAGGALSDSLTIATPVSVSVTFNGGSGNDTVYGSPAETTWMITGVGAGYAGNLSFSEVENLVGAAGNRDTFVFEGGGSLAGTVEGGAGGYDTVISHGSKGHVVSTITGPQSGNKARTPSLSTLST